MYFSNAYGYSHLYGDGYTHIVLKNLKCDGSETDIGNCQNDQWVGPHDSVTSCTHNYDIGVNCDGGMFVQIVRYFEQNYLVSFIQSVTSGFVAAGYVTGYNRKK